VCQCFNCQSFGHSSNYCVKPAKCVKCDQPQAKKDCPKPTSALPKCVNCSGEHPANFSGCPQYQQQLRFTQRPVPQRQHQAHRPDATQPTFWYQRSAFPILQTPHLPHGPQRTWAHVTAQPLTSFTQPSFSTTLDSVKSILAMFDLHKLGVQLRSLALILRQSTDPITKLVAVIDTVIGCLSSSPWIVTCVH
jgi:hypothetical protein